MPPLEYNDEPRVVEMRDAKAKRAIEARAAVETAVKALRKMTVAEASAGRRFHTVQAETARFTVTMSVREATAMIRVTGPISAQGSDGATARLLTAMAVVQRQVPRTPDGGGLGMIAALQVLQVAINDCLWDLRHVPPLKRVRAKRSHTSG